MHSATARQGSQRPQSCDAAHHSEAAQPLLLVLIPIPKRQQAGLHMRGESACSERARSSGCSPQQRRTLPPTAVKGGRRRRRCRACLLLLRAAAASATCPPLQKGRVKLPSAGLLKVERRACSPARQAGAAAAFVSMCATSHAI